jgi:hypothetical protein
MTISCSLFKPFRAWRLLCAVLMASCSVAHAASVSVTTANSTPTQGQIFTVDFTVSALSGAPQDSLSGFDMDIRFDPTLLQLTGASFIDSTGGVNQLDLPEAGSFGFLGSALVNGNLIDAFGLSGNSASLLDSNQAGAFRFLSLDFRALAPSAATRIGIDTTDPNLLFTASAAGLLNVNYASTGVTVAIAAVPEPTTVLMLTAGLLVLLVAARRRLNGRAIPAAALLVGAICTASPATAQTRARAPAATATAPAAGAISGVIVAIKGRRITVQLASGGVRSFSVEQALAPSEVGKKVSGIPLVRGDTDFLTVPVVSD